MDIKKRVVIIGGCVAAKEAANAIRSVDPTCDIIMISSEDYLPYYRPMLSRAIGQEVPTSKFCLAPKEWYQERNIQLILGTTVSQIFPDENAVITCKGDKYEYTHLLIATGANNFIPIPQAMSVEGVFSIRSYDDVIKLRSQLPDIKRAVIVGSGLLGLEAAWELKQQNIDVTLVELASHILPKQFDPEAAEFLSLHLEEKGITLACSNSIKSIMGTEKIQGVECTNGETFPCDLLLFSVGARPNLELTKNTSITTDKGIIVNEFMQTNIPNIYAAGDVAQNLYNNSGIWIPAMEMGKIAGYNIAGKHLEYSSSHIPTMLAAFDIRAFSIGSITDDPSLISETIIDSKSKIFKKLYAKDNILVGAILIGDISQGTRLAKQIGLLTLTEAKNMIE